MGGNWVRVWVLPGEGGGEQLQKGEHGQIVCNLNHVLLENS